MVVKFEKAKDHMRHLAETFSTLREYKIKLNPSKCTFGVSSGNFLGYIVTQRGIEASTEQIKAVLQLESPEKPKDVQRLAGKVASLSRFISRSSDKCRLFYDILKKSQRFEWTAEHEQAFRELKQYLSTPPLLSKPEQGEPLFLYLAVTEVAVSVVLVREQDKEQRPVYYVSKSLLTLLLKNCGYDIRYDPRTAIKSQALADFVSDFSPAIQNLADKEILTLKGDKEAEATNNETEYEALILGMQLALELGVRNLQGFKDDSILKSRKRAKIEIQRLQAQADSRDQNIEADTLTTLGATFKPTELANIPIAHVLEASIQKTEEVDKGELEDEKDMESGLDVLSNIDDQAADLDWRLPYLDWLKHGNLPDDKKEVRGFIMKASRFTLIDDVLFRKSLVGPYLRCLDIQEPQTVLHALHSGECGNHAGVRAFQTKLSDKVTSGLQ
ncbi:uncharacterized protein LOC141628059 [Silene latifolia]|uniref:uncharacterized protein LOC141628059 n=1 Tax=Silene latifolia TaxID=37657 RepID=UPI003D76EDC8